ncbi:hypothetical protein [Caballeronia sp. RCC_10]
MFTDDIEATYELTDVERVMVSRFVERHMSDYHWLEREAARS